MSDERSLGDKTDDGSIEVERGPLDVSGFLEGVRSLRRQVRIRPNLHLFAELERLRDEVEAALDADEDADDLIDAYEAAKALFLCEERWVVEQRSIERQKRVREAAAKALGVTLDDKGNAADPVQGEAVEAHVMADHVIEPEGVTADDITALFESSPNEGTKLGSAIVRVQRVLDEAAEREVLRDFSSRRSGRAPRSSKR